MRIQLISDLHLDFHQDGGVALIEQVTATKADVLVIAGDIAEGPHVKDALQALCPHYRHVVYVRGNHELYGGRFPKLTSIPNLHYLENDSVRIDGVRFLGTTLWFKKTEASARYQKAYADFHHIPGFVPWVYEQHEKALKFLEAELREDDVLITHFMPFRDSIPAQFENSALNDFFYAGDDSDILIRSRQPRLVLHGHTHSAQAYQIGDMTVVCNPLGYPGENTGFRTDKVIELSLTSCPGFV